MADKKITDFDNKATPADADALYLVQVSDSTDKKVTASQLATYVGTKLETTYTSGEVIETLTGMCNGQTVVGKSGSYTWPNVTAYTEVSSTTYADLDGSEITYTPPAGATKVVYKMTLHSSRYDSNPMLHYRFYIDSDEVTLARTTTRARDLREQRDIFEYVIEIGGTADAATGRVASWTTPKTLKRQVRCYSTTLQGRVNALYTWDGVTGGAAVQLVTPSLTITAIA